MTGIAEFVESVAISLGLAYCISSPFVYGLKLAENEDVYKNIFRKIPRKEQIITALPPLVDQLYFHIITRGKKNRSGMPMDRW